MKGNIVPKIKKYVMDESLSWEERYKQLEDHHIKEVTWFAEELNKTKKELQDAIAEYTDGLEGS